MTIVFSVRCEQAHFHDGASSSRDGTQQERSWNFLIAPPLVHTFDHSDVLCVCLQPSSRSVVVDEESCADLVRPSVSAA